MAHFDGFKMNNGTASKNTVMTDELSRLTVTSVEQNGVLNSEQFNGISVGSCQMNIIKKSEQLGAMLPNDSSAKEVDCSNEIVSESDCLNGDCSLDVCCDDDCLHDDCSNVDSLPTEKLNMRLETGQVFDKYKFFD